MTMSYHAIDLKNILLLLKRRGRIYHCHFSTAASSAKRAIVLVAYYNLRHTFMIRYKRRLLIKDDGEEYRVKPRLVHQSKEEGLSYHGLRNDNPFDWTITRTSSLPNELSSAGYQEVFESIEHTGYGYIGSVADHGIRSLDKGIDHVRMY
ncbi:hypothetical protein BJV82DRAFT_316226 [Fennellomyces sp. T-0311]|nr:hypothetical protein BJV82DRAFT_316226 [Fennellomyces sp. T-0311]